MRRDELRTVAVLFLSYLMFIQASGDGTVTCELVVSDQLSCGATEEGMQVETPNKVVEFTLIRIQQTYYY